MMCPIICITLALALLVLLGGLFLLAYSKKEGLGWMSKIASYVAITFGTVVFIGGLIAVLMCHSCDSNSKCGKKGGKCGTEMQKDCSGSSCESGEMKMRHGLKGEKHCEKGAMDCHHHNMKGSDKCEKGSKACCSEEKEVVKVIEKEVIKK